LGCVQLMGLAAARSASLTFLGFGEGRVRVGARGQILLDDKPADGRSLRDLPWGAGLAGLSRRLAGCHLCPNCHRVYSSKATLTRHLRAECGIGSRIQCPYCPHKAKRSDHLLVHIKKIHKEMSQ